MRMMTDIRFKLHFRPALLMMAAVAVLLLPVSCKDHDVYVENVIGMSAFHAGTRALVTNINDMGSQSVNDDTGFGVYGYKTKNSTNHTQIFTNQKVTATETTDAYTWSYTPLKYWDMSAYYHYVAYWPHKTSDEVVTHVINGSDHTLTLTIPNWQPSATGDDWMIATSAGNATSYFNRGNYTDGMVYFTFSHLLAQLEVQVALAEPSATDYYVTGLSIGNDPAFTTHTDCDVPDGNGTFSYNIDYSSSASGNYGNLDVTPGYATLYPVTPGATLPLTDQDQVLSSSLCVPFSVTGEGIFLNISYNTGPGTSDTKKSVVIPLSNAENLTELEEGKKYVVKLRFEMGETLRVVKVYINDWETGSTLDHQFFNW